MFEIVGIRGYARYAKEEPLVSMDSSAEGERAMQSAEETKSSA
jgi:hypothetical protein